MPPTDEAPWIIEFFNDWRGRSPARNFLRSLNEHEREE
jgi:hypothetical protein